MENIEQLIVQMESCWLAQLIREFDNICYQYRVCLDPPIFELTKSKKMLGSWQATDRIISISAHLILTQPWSVTLQVLKHEMAHQVCSELFHDKDSGHGETFNKACSMLGVESSFQRAAADTAEMVDELKQRGLSPDHHILEKVRKLLALGQSGNEHEAKLALEKATALLARHNLSLSSLAEERELVHLIIETKKQRVPVYQRMIWSLLDKWFFVRVIAASRYHPYDDKVYKTVELFGASENVAIAEYSYYFLEERLDTLWRQYKNTTGSKQRIAKKSYYVGLLTGFAEGLALGAASAGTNDLKQIKESNMTLIATETRITSFVEFHFPRLKKVSRRSIKVDKEAYEDAKITGRQLKLNRPVQNRKVKRFLS